MSLDYSGLRRQNWSMCNLYSFSRAQAEAIALARALRDKAGNLPPLPDIFPDQMAPVISTGADGVRELWNACT